MFFYTSWMFGQYYDNNWLFGRSGQNNPLDTTYGTSIIDFNLPHELKISFWGESIIDFDGFNVSTSDAEGNYIFSCNGHYIEDTSFSIMENGDSLNLYEPDDVGYRLPQGGLALPYPGHSNQYVLFHGTKGRINEGQSNSSTHVLELNYSIIDMELNNGLGAVSEKKQLIIEDTLKYGFITACQHANGRDWWVLVNKEPSNFFYKILVSAEGVQVKGTQYIGEIIEERGLGQAVFSPDGEKYIIYTGISAALGNFLHIYDFDRCTGELYNPQLIRHSVVVYAEGAAISPNSRYLYLPVQNYIFQYDLWADDIASTLDTVAIYDGFGDPFPTVFFLAQLAPDGKIYISHANSSNYLSIIHRPDEPGDACDVEQHGLRLPSRNFVSIPNNPYYRLGPLDGSACDTLGIDNVPVAQYRYWQDTVDILDLEFTDLSFYEPESWDWDFGDGHTSTERNPLHRYDEIGIYDVCLTVSNSYGEHTQCYTLHLGVTSTGEPAPPIETLVYPNPADEFFILSYDATQKVDAVLYDATGRQVQRQSLVLGSHRQQEWDVSGLEAGMYFLQGYVGGQIVFREKVLIF